MRAQSFEGDGISIQRLLMRPVPDLARPGNPQNPPRRATLIVGKFDFRYKRHFLSTLSRRKEMVVSSMCQRTKMGFDKPVPTKKTGLELVWELVWSWFGIWFKVDLAKLV